MPEAGLESWLQGWGLAQRKQEEATPISMHYTAFLQNEYKTLVLSFCVRERRGGKGGYKKAIFCRNRSACCYHGSGGGGEGPSAGPWCCSARVKAEDSEYRQNLPRCLQGKPQELGEKGFIFPMG